MNIHQQIGEKLPLYVRGGLRQTEQVQVETHLHECKQCRRVCQDWRRLSQVVQAEQLNLLNRLELPPLTLPKPAPSRLALPGHNLKWPTLERRTALNHNSQDRAWQTGSRRRLYRNLSGGFAVVVLIAALLVALTLAAQTPSPNTSLASGGATGAQPTSGRVPATATATLPAPTTPPAKTASDWKFRAGLTNSASDLPQGVALSLNGQNLAASQKDGQIKLWRTSDLSLIKTIPAPQSDLKLIWALINWSPNSQTLVAAYYFATEGVATSKVRANLVFYNAKGEQTAQVATLDEEILSLAWSPDSHYLATSGSGYDQSTRTSKNTLRLWDSQGKPVRNLLENQPNPVHRLAWSPDSRLLATESENGASAGAGILQLWQPDGRLVASYSSQVDPSMAIAQIEVLSWSPNGKWLAVGRATESDNLRLYDRQQMETGQPKPWISLAGHTNFVGELAWSSDSQTLASSSVDQSVRLWSLAKASQLKQINAAQVDAPLAWSPDGQYLAFGYKDGQIQLCNPQGGTLKTLTDTGSVHTLAWLPTGQNLLSVNDSGAVNFWTK